MSLISCDVLRDLVSDIDIPEDPDKPVLPAGVPRNFKEALFYNDMCAIPLKSGDEWVYTLMGYRGGAIRDENGDLISYPTYEEAIEVLAGYKEFLKGGES